MKIKNLEAAGKQMTEEISTKNATINLLKSDCELLSQRLSSQVPSLTNIQQPTKQDFVTPKNTSKPQKQKQPFKIPTMNSYALLSSPETDQEDIHGEAQTHHPNTSSLTTSARSTPGSDSNTNNRNILQAKNKSRVILLADSQGKDFHSHLKKLDEKHDVFVYAKSGAKMKHVVKEGLNLIQDFTKNDYVVLLAGSNDIGYYEPKQLTIAQGMNLLMACGLTTNVIVQSIPYRYDDTALNDDIFHCNIALKKMIYAYRGSLNLIYEETNYDLKRTHFTKHGLHYSRHGKKYLGERMRKLILRLRTDSKSTLPEPEALGGGQAKVPQHQRSNCEGSVNHGPSPNSLQATRFHNTRTEPAPDSSQSSPLLFTLPYETYADAVVQNFSPQRPKADFNSPASLMETTSAEDHSTSCELLGKTNFLVSPLPSNGAP